MIGIIQPKRSFFIDIFLGGSFGLLRGYIIAVLLFGLTNSISPINIKNFKSIDNAIFIEIVEMGINFVGEIPKGFEKITEDLESACSRSVAFRSQSNAKTLGLLSQRTQARMTYTKERGQRKSSTI